MADAHKTPDLAIDSLRRLARGLVYDRDSADDLVQEAWLAALRSRSSVLELGGWLRGMMRHLAGRSRRDAARRRRREESAARPEATPSTADISGRLEIVQRLLDAVNALDEPYRSAVVLRYFDELPPRAIARKLGIPVNTARTHVRRGLERLRRQLDGERGRGREELLAALGPFVGEPSLPGESAARPLVATNKAWIAAGAAFVGCLWLGWLVWFGHGASENELSSLEPTTSANVERSSGATLASVPLEGRTPVPANSTALTGAWIVRGVAYRGPSTPRGPSEPFPLLPLTGRVFQGWRAEGTPLVEQDFITDEAGAFAWALDPPTDLVTVVVEPRIDGHVIDAMEAVFVPGDAAPVNWSVGAYPLDCSLRGTVRDSVGQRVPHAEVWEHRDQRNNLRAVCDDEGRYSLRLAARDGLSSELVPEAIAPGFASATLEVDASLGGDVDVPDFVLAEEVRASGRVLDAGGSPVAGATVQWGWSCPHETVSTDEAGAFVIAGLAPDADDLELTVTKSGYARSRTKLAPEQWTDPIEVRLAKGIRVVGRVRAADGSPVWGALVAFGDGSERMRPESQACTDRDGGFEFPNVPTGAKRFTVDRWLGKQSDVWIPENVEAFEVELSLTAFEHFLAGTVVDAAGLPVASAQVAISSPRSDMTLFAGTDAEGRFRVTWDVDGPVNLIVLVDDQVCLDRRVTEIDREDVVVNLPPTSWLSGRVIDADSGEPIPRFTVDVEDGAPDSVPGEFIHAPGRHTFKSADGSWSLAVWRPEDHALTLAVRAPGHVPSDVGVVRTKHTPSSDDVVIRLPKTTRVRGRVVDRATGGPVAAASVRSASDGSSEVQPGSAPDVRTDADGRFELIDVPAGEMRLAIEAPGWAPAIDGPFRVVDATPVERTIELGTGITLRGSLLDTQGSGLGDQLLSLTARDELQRDHEWTATTDAHGRFQFTGLVPGSVRLDWRRWRGEVLIRSLGERFDIAQDEEEIVLQPLGRSTLRGTIGYADGLPDVVRVWIEPVVQEPLDPARVRWSHRHWSVDAEHGRFEIGPLEPGEYEVSSEFDISETESSYVSAYGAVHVHVPEQGLAETHVELQIERQEY